MFNLAVKNFFEKNLPLKVYGNLKQEDIPGATLSRKTPEECTEQLQRWLLCRGAKITGKKLELAQRYKAAFKFVYISGFFQTSRSNLFRFVYIYSAARV